MSRIFIAFIISLFLLTTTPSWAAFDSAEAPATNDLTVQLINPDGDDAPASRQIAIEFNRPVVAVGKMDRSSSEIPITITPSLACQWRWITTRTLACNLDDKDAMRPATEYKIEIKPGIQTLDGVTLANPVEHTFSTQAPRVQDADFRVWNAPTDPVIRVVFNQPVTKSSVLQHLFLLDKDQKRVQIDVAADQAHRILPRWLHIPGEKSAVVTNEDEQVSDDELTQFNGQEARRIWIIEPVHVLPEGQHIELHEEPGFVSALGPLPSVAQDTVKEFDTFPSFALVSLRCTDNSNGEIHVKPGDVQKAETLCDPLAPIALEFSSPVSRNAVKNSLTLAPWAYKASSGNSPWGDLDDEDKAVTFAHTDGNVYSVFLPGGLKAAQAYSVGVEGGKLGLWHWLRRTIMAWLGKPLDETLALHDRFGRTLPEKVQLSFATDHRQPNVLLEYSAAVLEKTIDSDVPVYVDNIKTIKWSYNRITSDVTDKDVSFTSAVPGAVDIQFQTPLGIRSMLNQQSGALWGGFTTNPPMSDERQNKLFAEVTPFQVHFKLGHFNSLVWVTDLATGQPVANADVVIYKSTLDSLNGPPSNAPIVHTDADGLATLPGTEELDPQLETSNIYGDSARERFFVRVTKDKDIALLPLWSQFEIDSYRSSGTSFFPQWRKKFGHMVTWGTTAQGIYHPGDTIQYKFYVRNQDNNEITKAPQHGYWLEVYDPTGKLVYNAKDVVLSEFGSASGEFPVSKKAAVGWYNFRLKANFGAAHANDDKNTSCDDSQSNDDNEDNSDAPDDGDGNAQDGAGSEDPQTASCGSVAQYTWTPLRVLVSDFTPVPFQVSNQLTGDLFHPGDNVGIETSAKLHSGGPYTQAASRVTAILTPSRFVSKDPAAQGFTFGSELLSTEPEQVFETSSSLDAQGVAKAEFKLDDKKIYHGRLMIESAVQDDRGKSVTHQAYADYVGVDRFAGMHLNSWFYSTEDDIGPAYIVTNDHGTPVKGVPVTFTLERKDRTAAKVKSAGNSYVPETETTLVKEDECRGTSSLTGDVCHLKAHHSGEYILRETISDTAGRAQETTAELWLSGPGYVMWDDGSDATLDIIPDQQSYHIADTAHFLVKNPYPGAKALVTVERYGVIDHFEMTLKDSAAVIDLPIKPEYLPGFYLSVNIMSPRVDKPAEAGQVDLGKPTFRMGYVKVPVKDPYKEITVTATPDQDIYRPGDKVHVKLHAKPRFPKAEHIELAVAVLDDAVLDLIAGGSTYYDPYAGFYNLDNLDLRNFSLLTRLVGRQKFEKKGANPGGDGGSALNMRSVFKYVSYWNPSLPVDANGNAEIEFPVPDNLTGWHIFALASTPSDRFGLGESDFKVNRPTEIRPEMPNQVSEGDQFQARFSVMNRTKSDRTLKVTLKAAGDIDTSTLPDHIEKTLTLKPYERALVELPVRAAHVSETRETEVGSIDFTAQAGDATDADGTNHHLPVNKLRSLDVGANYGTTTSDKATEAVAVPDDILPDVGSISVSVSPSVIGNLEGAFKYLRDYPYPCWEQVLTRGVMAAHFKTLRAYISGKFTWSDAEGLPDKTLLLASEYQAPGGGMAYFVPTDDHADPYLSAYTALAFNWLRQDGYTVPQTVEKKLHAYLLNILRHNDVPTFYSEGMTSTVRAVALAALAETHEVDPSDIERYAPFVKQMSLFGVANFAKAAMLVPGEQKQALEAAKMLLAHANETAGKYTFNEELDDSYTRILATPLRDNCAILSLFTALGETDYGKPIAGDVPYKLVRTITQTRKSHDHWENTQENMFCMNALTDFSRAYEKDKPNMKVTASLNGEVMGTAPFVDFTDQGTTFVHPIEAKNVGQKESMVLSREGIGRLYYVTTVSYAPRAMSDDGTNAGMEIHREYSTEKDGKWSLLKKPFALHQGDVVRVDLFLSLPATRNFVVVDDPVPGGLEPVNADFANSSKVDATKGDFIAAGGSLWFKYSDWNEYNFSFWSFNHRELLHNAARFYADYLPAGNYHLSYTAQAIGAGDFAIMPTLASEMYDPDVYGKSGFDHLTVNSNLDAAPHLQ